MRQIVLSLICCFRLSAAFDARQILSRSGAIETIADFPLRRGDIYDLSADVSKPAPLVYSRIGNDIEQISFFGASAARIARALLPLLDSPDPEMRRLAERAVPIVRETNFPAVNAIAGDRGAEAATLLSKVTSADVAAIVKPAQSPVRQSGVERSPAPQKRLDQTFFKTYIDPILRKKGKDGYACANCHATHTLFNATRSTVMNVVDTADPENSL